MHTSFCLHPSFHCPSLSSIDIISLSQVPWIIYYNWPECSCLCTSNVISMQRCAFIFILIWMSICWMGTLYFSNYFSINPFILRLKGIQMSIISRWSINLFSKLDFFNIFLLSWSRSFNLCEGIIFSRLIYLYIYICSRNICYI